MGAPPDKIATEMLKHQNLVRFATALVSICDPIKWRERGYTMEQQQPEAIRNNTTKGYNLTTGQWQIPINAWDLARQSLIGIATRLKTILHWGGDDMTPQLKDALERLWIDVKDTNERIHKMGLEDGVEAYLKRYPGIQLQMSYTAIDKSIPWFMVTLLEPGGNAASGYKFSHAANCSTLPEAIKNVISKVPQSIANQESIEEQRKAHATECQALFKQTLEWLVDQINKHKGERISIEVDDSVQELYVHKDGYKLDESIIHSDK